MTICLVWGMAVPLFPFLFPNGCQNYVRRSNSRNSWSLWVFSSESSFTFKNKAGISKMPEVGIYDSPEANAFATDLQKITPRCGFNRSNEPNER